MEKINLSPLDNSALFPIGQMGYATHPIDRAAYLRDDPEKLFALEGKADARAYVLHRDSIVVKLEGDSMRAALTLSEARDFGANPGTIFLGLRNGEPLFGMGLPADSAEKLKGRNDVALEALRGLAMDGRIPPPELNSIAIAKSLVHWHQRHGFCANCGARTALSHGGWKRDCAACKTEHFPRTDPVVIMLVTHGEKALLGRSKHFVTNSWSCLAGFVEPAETIEDAVRREVFEEAGITCGDVHYYKAQPWPYPHSLMIGCIADARTSDITVDKSELDDARWFERADVAKMLRREHPDGLVAPTGIAIAHHLLGHWAFKA
jgi:NAD+ diphosphatase